MKKPVVWPFIVKKTGCIVHGLSACFFWCCRIIWNFCILFLSAFSALFGLVSLFFLGAFLVLWLQGYPLGGIVLGAIGAVFCFGSFSVLGSTFIIRKSYREYPNKEDEEKIYKKLRLDTENGGENEG